MYNLINDEILIVDGGGSSIMGNALVSTTVGIVSGKVFGAGWGTAISLGHSIATASNAFGNAPNRTGTNQTYGGDGQDSGGGMMQAGGSTCGYRSFYKSCF